MSGIGSRLLGLEHEYRLLAADGSQLDMRSLGQTLDLDGVRADPGDPHALRGPHGGVITADGREAEIATPPLPAGPGVLDRLGAHCDAAVDDLVAALDPTVRLEGYSTHLNIETPDRRCRATAVRLTHRWGPALMLLTLHRESPGLLVRPRWNRLEIGCEFLPPAAWRAALVTAAGSVTVAERRREPRTLAALTAEIVPSRQRFGWYLDRRAFGPDLLVEGRDALLSYVDGRRVRAQQHLELVWETVRSLAVAAFGEARVADVDRLVAGEVPLPCECPPLLVHERSGAPADLLARRPLSYEVAGYTVRPAALTWRTAVFEIAGPGRPRWIRLPGPDVAVFLEGLHAGRFDEAFASGRRRIRLPAVAITPDSGETGVQ